MEGIIGGANCNAREGVMESCHEMPSVHSPALIDVRSQNFGVPDKRIKEIYAYGAGLQSLNDIVDLYQFANLEFLSLHGNQIQSMKGLEGLLLLKELNLSANKIKRMEGLSNLCQLRVLDLSCNQIEEIRNVQGLSALTRLLLSHNKITRLHGLSALHGPQYSLQTLDLRDNAVRSLAELDMLSGCMHLVELTFTLGKYSNPVCEAPAYKSAVVAAVPHILKLDGETLCPGPQFAPAYQGVPMVRGNADSLSPSWDLHYNRNGLQDLHSKDLCAILGIEHSQPQQFSLQVQAQESMSAKFLRHQSVPESVAPHPRPLYNNLRTSAGQPYVTCPHCQHDMNDSTFAGSAHNIPCKPYKAPGCCQVLPVETPTWVDQPSSSNLISMADLSHPTHTTVMTSSGCAFCTGTGLGSDPSSCKNRSGLSTVKQLPTNIHMERNPEEEIYRLISIASKVDSSSQTTEEAWFRVLEEKVLDLVHKVTDNKVGSKGEAVGHSKTSGLPPMTASWQREDAKSTAGLLRKQQKGSCSNFHEETGDLSSEGTSDSQQNSKSERPHLKTPPRRWVHFGNKWKGEKNMISSQRKLATVDDTGESDTIEGFHKEDLRWSGGKLDRSLVGNQNQSALKQLCKEVRNLQTVASKRTEELHIMQFVEQLGTILFKGDEKNATICKLTEDNTLLEGKLVNFEEKLAKEKNDFQKSLQGQQAALLELQKTLQQKDCRVEELTAQVEKYSSERDQYALGIQDKYHRKFLSLNTGLISMKEALEVANRARQCKVHVQTQLAGWHVDFAQNAESALLDVTAEKENSRQLAISVGQGLKVEHAKLEACKSELEACKSHGLELQKEVEKYAKESLDAEDEKQKALEHLSKVHKREMEDAVFQEAAAGESRGMNAAEKSFEHFREAMRTKLLNAQKEFQGACQESIKTRQDMNSRLEEKERQNAELKETLRSLLMKEEDKDTLVIELSSAVRSQKAKLQAVHLELERLAEAEEDLQKKHQEVIFLRRKADKHDNICLEIESLQQKLMDTAQDAEMQRGRIEEKFRAKLLSLQQENKKLSAASEKLEAMDGALKIKRKMLAAQNETIKELQFSLSQSHETIRELQLKLSQSHETIKELQLDLSQSSETVKKSSKSSEALEVEWRNRLKIEIDQREACESKLAKQNLAMAGMEQKLRFERAAKVAAEKSSRALNESLLEKEGMFRYVEDEILQVKELYDGRAKEMAAERNGALEELKAAQKERDQLGKSLADAQKRHQELQEGSKAFQTREAQLKAQTIEKDTMIAQVSRRLVEVEGELKSQRLAMETQKAASATKLDQLRKLLEELRDSK